MIMRRCNFAITACPPPRRRRRGFPGFPALSAGGAFWLAYLMVLITGALCLAGLL
jgi:hypothetical protein